VVEGDVVALTGDVRVEGEVMGDVTVGKGNLILAPGAVIHGDAVVGGGGKLFNEGGRVHGEMRVNSEVEAAASGRGERHVERRVGRNTVSIRHGPSWMGSFGGGVQGLISTLTFGLLLAALGSGLVFYALPQLDRVSHVVRTDGLRAGGVGLAANFLSIPAFIVGLVALAVTVIGIPLLLLYIPLFWVALAAACAYGVVAVAHAIGERTAERSGTYAASKRNAYSYVFTGIAVLLAPLFVAHVLEMTVFLGWLGGLLALLGNILLWLAATVGFGAVFLTRGGTRRGWPWRPRGGYDPLYEADAALDAELAGRRAGG
ncbi:MAG TPA: polymer-forming cytoskeletal protein, partial [Longimicrobiaceae bacterium]|nr:polymer-forming cytoskeletal protein [Longimicrobiaceae bacterium]